MTLPLSKEQKIEAMKSIRRFFSEKLELELSEVQAGFLLDYFWPLSCPFFLQPWGDGRPEIPDAVERGSVRDLFSGATDILAGGWQFDESPS